MGGRETAAVIVAAGRGERAGQTAEGPKQYRPIGGRAVIWHTLNAFASHPAIGRIVVAIHPEDDALFRAAAEGIPSEGLTVVHGGPTRQASTRLALLALKDWPPEMVLVHDAVRPFADQALISRVADALTSEHGALPALPVSDTLKRADADGLISETVPRDGLHAAQTPQGFPFRLLLEAHERAAAEGREDFTDDAAIAEWAGLPVGIVPGSPDNVKLTWAKDLEMADRSLAGAARYPDIRTGNGYDVHAFEPGDQVVLCGVPIAHDQKLSGHSDADVGLHALTDALLATCGAGDIGVHFPPSEARWKGAASQIFVERAADIVRGRGGRIANVDVTLICEAPKIGPHREAMLDAMAGMLGIARDRVSVKATTNERLGFIGRGEGIAAIATACVIFPGEVPG
jgi:2-C-methyl-D-erythritol 4-phosphate cytidylyltransferase/2-C-methyl-D-erythritol 2,4-cyclodiphosphate synthase